MKFGGLRTGTRLSADASILGDGRRGDADVRGAAGDALKHFTA